VDGAGVGFLGIRLRALWKSVGACFAMRPEPPRSSRRRFGVLIAMVISWPSCDLATRRSAGLWEVRSESFRVCGLPSLTLVVSRTRNRNPPSPIPHSIEFASPLSRGYLGLGDRHGRGREMSRSRSGASQLLPRVRSCFDDETLRTPAC